MATDKIDAFINETHKLSENVKEAAKALRARYKNAAALIDSGLLDDSQVERLKSVLPKKREPKADA